MSRTTLCLLACAAISLPAAAAKGVHLWYDENGQAVFSQFAPAPGTQSTLVKPPPPPAESPEVANRRLQQQLQKFEDNREDEALAAEKAGEAATKREQADENCRRARKNLELLNGRPRQLYKTPDGKVTRLSEEERQKRRDNMQEIIEKDCK